MRYELPHAARSRLIGTTSKMLNYSILLTGILNRIYVFIDHSCIVYATIIRKRKRKKRKQTRKIAFYICFSILCDHYACIIMTFCYFHDFFFLIQQQKLLSQVSHIANDPNVEFFYILEPLINRYSRGREERERFIISIAFTGIYKRETITGFISSLNEKNKIGKKKRKKKEIIPYPRTIVTRDTRRRRDQLGIIKWNISVACANACAHDRVHAWECMHVHA